MDIKKDLKAVLPTTCTVCGQTIQQGDTYTGSSCGSVRRCKGCDQNYDMGDLSKLFGEDFDLGIFTGDK